MSTLSSVLRNASFSIGADLSARIANAALFISITHYLGADAAGAFSLGITYFLITSRFGFWGLDHLLVREVSPQHDLTSKHFVNFAALRIVIAVVMVTFAAIIVWQLPYAYETRVVIIIMLIAVLPDNVTNICQSVFIAHERMEFVGLVSVVVAVVRVSLSLLLLFTGASLLTLAMVYTATSFVGLAVYLVLLLPRHIRSPIKFDLAFCRQSLRVALPFVLISTVFVVDNRVDVLMLSFLLDEASVGVYTAALTIVAALAILPQGVRTAIFPVLARRFRNDASAMGDIYVRVFKYLLIMALPIAAGISLLSVPIITLVYPPEFAAAASVLRILIWWLLFYSLNVLNSRILIINNDQRLIARYLLISLAVNVAINILLIPRLGLTAAAIAKVVAGAVIFIQSELATRRVLSKPPLWRIAVRPVLACAFMSGIVWLATDLGLWLQIMIGGLVYITSLLALGVFSKEELVLWRGTIYNIIRPGKEHDTSSSQ